MKGRAIHPKNKAEKERVTFGLRNSDIFILPKEYAIPTGSGVYC